MKKKVLLVDDDKWTHDYLRMVFDDYGYNVELSDAYTPLEAFEEIRSGQYDAVLIDYRLHPMDAIDIVHAISDLGIKSKLYIFTGYDEYIVNLKLKSHKLENVVSGVITKIKMKEGFDKIFERDLKDGAD